MDSVEAQFSGGDDIGFRVVNEQALICRLANFLQEQFKYLRLWFDQLYFA